MAAMSTASGDWPTSAGASDAGLTLKAHGAGSLLVGRAGQDVLVGSWGNDSLFGEAGDEVEVHRQRERQRGRDVGDVDDGVAELHGKSPFGL